MRVSIEKIRESLTNSIRREKRSCKMKFAPINTPEINIRKVDSLRSYSRTVFEIEGPSADYESIFLNL